MSAVDIHPFGESRLADYLRFFDTRAFADNPRWAGCYCYFPHHDPKTTDWAQRSASQNREAMCGRIAAGAAQGWLAYRDGEVVGWCNAGPRALYPMLADEPLPGGDEVGVVFCFVIAPGERRQGTAAALLAVACDGLRAQGLRRVLARPVRDAASDAANHTGPLAMYLAAGFAVVGEDAEGNVLVQRSLAG